MSLTLEWQEREPPLAVAGAMARGAVAAQLARALFVDDERRKKCVAVGVGDALVVLSDDLPWVDGMVWLGLEDGLLMPTRLQPCIDGTRLASSIVHAAVFRDRTPVGIAVVTPGFVLVAQTPSGPPPLEVLAHGAGFGPGSGPESGSPT